MAETLIYKLLVLAFSNSIQCVLSHDLPYNPIASGRHIENLRINDDVKKL